MVFMATQAAYFNQGASPRLLNQTLYHTLQDSLHLTPNGLSCTKRTGWGSKHPLNVIVVRWIFLWETTGPFSLMKSCTLLTGDLANHKKCSERESSTKMLMFQLVLENDKKVLELNDENENVIDDDDGDVYSEVSYIESKAQVEDGERRSYRNWDHLDKESLPRFSPF
jgi:hypothetical protein